MSSLDWQDVLQEVSELATMIGRLQMENLGKAGLTIETKTTGIDLVTEIDKRSEEQIVAFIQSRFPGHAILAEESGHTGRDSDYLWIIDPLDGTTNYAQGLPVFAVSIALQHRNETVLGVVYAPGVGHMFTAISGQGAYFNGRPISVSRKEDLKQCVLATGFPYDVATHADNNLDYFNYFLTRSRAIRRFGAAAYDLAGVACGMFDGYWEMCLKPWDAAAGILLVQEAGGTVVSFREDRSIAIIAGNRVICQKIAAGLRQVDGQRS